MAELVQAPERERWSAAQTRAQYGAIARLRWRMLLNGFRRKGGTGDLIARIITIPIVGSMMVLPTVAAGWIAWYVAHHNNLEETSFLLWGIFAFTQLLNINLGQPGTTFNPTELIRFPMRLRSYVAIRLFFGLMAPANVVVTVTSLAVAIGLTFALPSLWPFAFLAMLVFAATNVFFTRMLFSWIDRWMSTRRAREVFTALVFTISLSFQYLNVTFNSNLNRHHHGRQVSSERVNAAVHFYHKAEPVLNLLPPGLLGNSLASAYRGAYGAFVLGLAGCALFACAFLGVFMLRMRTEFHGENLSDAANAVSTRKPVAQTAGSGQMPASARASLAAEPEQKLLDFSSTVSAALSKEFLYLRRNSGLFYGMIAPIVMVIIFAGRLTLHQNGWWIFPSALAYTMIGLSPLAYNSFGLEGSGSQFYFLAPAPLRAVFLAKNLIMFFMAVVEGFAVWLIFKFTHQAPSFTILLVAALWTMGTMLLNVTVGNFRSISAPKKINLNRTANKQASPLSALMSIGLLLLATAFGGGVLVMARYLELSGLVPVLAMLVYAALGLTVYVGALRNIDEYALDHRESMFEELCKQ